ncbi:MAG: MBL fold metallo-hydrolase [Pseudobdellovibrionaceae bacterium]
MKKSSLSLQFWGVRGSIPVSPSPVFWKNHIGFVLEDYFQAFTKTKISVSEYMAQKDVPEVAGFGAATTCVEVVSDVGRLIIDGGSGIRSLSEQIMRGNHGTMKGPHHILMTHFHWDHVIGLPFFSPHFVPGAEIHYYAVQNELPDLIRGIFQKPYFPVPFDKLPSKIHFHILEPRTKFKIADMEITPYKLDHPDPCWGYRINSGGKGYAHCVDTEGTRVSVQDLGADLPLYQNADLMYFDAQYTLPELAEKANWGHSASQVGLDIAMREKIKYVLFAHHDPGASLEDMNNLRLQTGEYHTWLQSQQRGEPKHNFTWEFAYEGMIVHL